MYTAILERIIELAPNLRKNLQTVLSDFEAAGQNAVNDLFPNAFLRGCLFHYDKVRIIIVIYYEYNIVGIYIKIDLERLFQSTKGNKNYKIY